LLKNQSNQCANVVNRGENPRQRRMETLVQLVSISAH
jgi:hypothetical protein